MRIIKKEDCENLKYSEVCNVKEYSFGDKDLDLGVYTIEGRYPDKGYLTNEKSKMIVYIVEGKGKLFVDDEFVYYEVGDTLLINPMDRYYWETDYSVISIVSNPAWSELQNKNV